MTPAEKETKKDIAAVEYVRTDFRTSNRLVVLVRNRNHGETIQRIATSPRIAEPAFQRRLQFENESELCVSYPTPVRRTRKKSMSRRIAQDVETGKPTLRQRGYVYQKGKKKGDSWNPQERAYGRYLWH